MVAILYSSRYPFSPRVESNRRSTQKGRNPLFIKVSILTITSTLRPTSGYKPSRNPLFIKVSILTIWSMSGWVPYEKVAILYSSRYPFSHVRQKKRLARSSKVAILYSSRYPFSLTGGVNCPPTYESCRNPLFIKVSILTACFASLCKTTTYNVVFCNPHFLPPFFTPKYQKIRPRKQGMLCWIKEFHHFL